MSKPVPPVRVSRSLYEAAELTGRIEHRSSAKQIEYWATIGQLANVHWEVHLHLMK